MTTPRSDIDEMTDVHVTRLLWREQAAALPQAARSALRRLFRREARLFLTDDNGRVLGRFTSADDASAFLTWVSQAHENTFNFGFHTGKEFLVAQHIAADAGHDRTP